MPGSHIAPEDYDKAVSAKKTLCIDFSGHLFPGETINSIDDLIVMLGGTVSADLVLTDEQVNGADLPVGNKLIPAGKAVVLMVAGGVAGRRYAITAKVITSAGQELPGKCYLRVVED